MFVLAMAMFAAGVTIARNVFTEADVVKERLSEKQRAQLEAILGEGPEKIKITYITKDLEIGGHDVFGIGIRNDLDAGQNFFIEFECDAAYHRDNTEICNADTGTCGFCTNWMTIDDGPYHIKKNDKHVQDLFIIVPRKSDDILTEPGTYIFNIRVCTSLPCDSSNQYGNTKKINVIAS